MTDGVINSLTPEQRSALTQKMRGAFMCAVVELVSPGIAVAVPNFLVTTDSGDPNVDRFTFEFEVATAPWL